MKRSLTALVTCLLGGVGVFGQGRGTPQAPRTPKATAPFDVTGYWVSVVTEDWRWRMFTPPKGDYTGVPLNPDGKKIADAWDPAKDGRRRAMQELWRREHHARPRPSAYHLPG